MRYDTSTPDELQAAAGFVEGWLESRDIDVVEQRPRRPAGASSPTSARPTPTRRRSSSTATSTSSRPTTEQFEPRIEGDRLIGRGAYDMKGALAAMMCARRTSPAQDARPRPLRLRPRRGVRGRRRPLDRRARRRRPHRRLRDHRRADRPAHRRPGQGRARRARRGRAAPPRTARRRGSATTRSSRRTTPSGASRRCRSAASPPTCSTARRSTSRGSRAATRSTRSPTAADGRRHPLPARTRTRARSSARSARSATSRSLKCFTRAPAIVSRRNPYVARCATRSAALDRGRGAERRPRRRLRRGLVPRGGHPGGRVRAGRRRPPRPRGVGLDRARCAATGRRSGTSSRALPAWLERERGDERPARGRGRPGVSHAATHPARGAGPASGALELLRAVARRPDHPRPDQRRGRHRRAARGRQRPVDDAQPRRRGAIPDDRRSSTTPRPATRRRS